MIGEYFSLPKQMDGEKQMENKLEIIIIGAT